MSAGDDYLKWKRRAEEAEAKLVEERAARHRAEADNAELRRKALAIAEWVPGCPRTPSDTLEEVRSGIARLAYEPHPGAALLEYVKALEAVLTKFREVEWCRGDWQGSCPFRRHKGIACPATDGRVAPLGTPASVPHNEYCPYHALAALKERKP